MTNVIDLKDPEFWREVEAEARFLRLPFFEERRELRALILELRGDRALSADTRARETLSAAIKALEDKLWTKEPLVEALRRRAYSCARTPEHRRIAALELRRMEYARAA